MDDMQAASVEKVVEQPTEEGNNMKNLKIIEKVNLDCLVLGECTADVIPAHIEQILQFYDPARIQPSEIVFILIYISAIENGYITQQDHATMLDELVMPAYGVNYYQSKNVLKLTRKRPAYEKRNDNSLYIMKLILLTKKSTNIDINFLKLILTAVVSGDMLILTLSPEKESSKLSGFSTVLTIGRFIINVFDKNKPIHKRFRKLNELAKIVAHDVFVPMRAQQNTILGKYPDTFLNRLPPELYAHILKFVSKKDKLVMFSVWNHLPD